MRFLVEFAALTVLAGCGGSVQGKVSVNTAEKPPATEIADFDKPMDVAEAKQSAVQAAPVETALLGARQDLTYKGPTAATCQCLAAALGQPGSAAFHWEGERPKTDPATELVVAVSSEGIACPAAGNEQTGASYWGYETSGKDVVVVVERAAPGRPIAEGAIIPRPGDGGHVYVRPLDKKVPYGGPLNGSGDRCQLPPAG